MASRASPDSAGVTVAPCRVRMRPRSQSRRHMFKPARRTIGQSEGKHPCGGVHSNRSGAERNDPGSSHRRAAPRPLALPPEEKLAREREKDLRSAYSASGGGAFSFSFPNTELTSTRSSTGLGLGG